MWETRPNACCTIVQIIGNEGGKLFRRVTTCSVYFMICSVFQAKPSMAAQNNLLVAFHTMKRWLLRSGLISSLQLEVLPEGCLCCAEVVCLINGSLLYFTVSFSDL